jgi:hypothetical protein
MNFQGWPYLIGFDLEKLPKHLFQETVAGAHRSAPSRSKLALFNHSSCGFTQPAMSRVIIKPSVPKHREPDAW